MLARTLSVIRYQSALSSLELPNEQISQPDAQSCDAMTGAIHAGSGRSASASFSHALRSRKARPVPKPGLSMIA